MRMRYKLCLRSCKNTLALQNSDRNPRFNDRKFNVFHFHSVYGIGFSKLKTGNMHKNKLDFNVKHNKRC